MCRSLWRRCRTSCGNGWSVPIISVVMKKQAGKPTQPPAETPACTEPGPFAYVAPAEAKPPLEASGAHSPARTAAEPPSQNKPDAQVNPKK